MSTLAEIKDYNPNTLAQMANCASPDNFHSAGAEFLKDVRDAFVEAAEDLRYANEDHSDVDIELADACVPVYNHKMWSVFVDLALWANDDEYLDLVPENATMLERCAAIIYLTARNLLTSLHHELMHDEDHDDEEEL